MSFLNVFRTKASKTFVDPLEEAHTAVDIALSVFHVATANLKKSLDHFDAVKQDAQNVIEHYQARHDEATAAADNSRTVLGKIEALLS